MGHPSPTARRRVLIASATPLFRGGLRRAYLRRRGKHVQLVGIPATMGESLSALESLSPDLVIVYYDHKCRNQAEFLI